MKINIQIKIMKLFCPFDKDLQILLFCSYQSVRVKTDRIFLEKFDKCIKSPKCDHII